MTIDPAESDLCSSFVVVVHDVAPVYRRELGIIFDALEPLLGNQIVAAVVPCWHGVPLGSAGLPGERDLIQRVRTTCGEIVQHGHTHRQLASGLISVGSGGSNELSGLSLAETRDRLRQGRAILLETLDAEVVGFTPPAWQVGRATLAEISSLGFRYLIEFERLHAIGQPAIPLATWSWDWGTVGALGRLGEWYGRSWTRLNPDAVPCVVVHPRDVDRAYLPRIIRVVEELRGQGRTPVTFSALIAGLPAGSPA